jgi:hypothetical protein
MSSFIKMAVFSVLFVGCEDDKFYQKTNLPNSNILSKKVQTNLSLLKPVDNIDQSGTEGSAENGTTNGTTVVPPSTSQTGVTGAVPVTNPTTSTSTNPGTSDTSPPTNPIIPTNPTNPTNPPVCAVGDVSVNCPPTCPGPDPRCLQDPQCPGPDTRCQEVTLCLLHPEDAKCKVVTPVVIPSPVTPVVIPTVIPTTPPVEPTVVTPDPTPDATPEVTPTTPPAVVPTATPTPTVVPTVVSCTEGSTDPNCYTTVPVVQDFDIAQAIDILWVVDNSLSISDNNRKIINNLQILIDNVNAQKNNLSMPNVNVQMGVTTTDTTRMDPILNANTEYQTGRSTQKSYSNNVWTTNATDTLQDKFSELYDKIFTLTDINNLTTQSVYQKNPEAGILGADNFFAKNPTWVRPNAYLAIIFMSDEEDYSYCTAPAIQSVIYGKKNGKNLTHNEDVCRAYSVSPADAVTRYLALKQNQNSLLSIFALDTVTSYAAFLPAGQNYARTYSDSRYYKVATDARINGAAMQLLNNSDADVQNKNFLTNIGENLNQLRNQYVLKTALQVGQEATLTLSLLDKNKNVKQTVAFTLNAERTVLTIDLTQSLVFESGDSLRANYSKKVLNTSN